MKRFIVMLAFTLAMLSACTPAVITDTTSAPDTAPKETDAKTEAQTTQEVTEEVKIPETLKVVTYNIQTQNGNSTPLSKRSAWLKTILSAYNPDIMGFQEVTVEWLKYLNKKLTDYSYVGEPRSGGANPGEYSPVFYKTDKYELIETKTFWLSETPEKESLGWDAAYPRICTYAVLKDKTTGTVIVHMNTHIDHKGKTAKIEQIKMIADYAKEHFADDYVVVTGDFNVNQDSENYKVMITDTIFADTKFSAVKTENFATFIKTYNENPEKPPIDFVFFNKTKFTADSYHVIMDTVDGSFPSDHFGICCEFTLQ